MAKPVTKIISLPSGNQLKITKYKHHATTRQWDPNKEKWGQPKKYVYQEHVPVFRAMKKRGSRVK